MNEFKAIYGCTLKRPTVHKLNILWRDSKSILVEDEKTHKRGIVEANTVDNMEGDLWNPGLYYFSDLKRYQDLLFCERVTTKLRELLKNNEFTLNLHGATEVNKILNLGVLLSDVDYEFNKKG